MTVMRCCNVIGIFDVWHPIFFEICVGRNCPCNFEAQTEFTITFWPSQSYTLFIYSAVSTIINPFTPNDTYRGPTAPLTSKRCILYIYSTNIGTEYFKHDIYSPFFSLQNAVCFVILTYLVPVLFTFYIQCVLKLKNKSGTKRLTKGHYHIHNFPFTVGYSQRHVFQRLSSKQGTFFVSEYIDIDDKIVSTVS